MLFRSGVFVVYRPDYEQVSKVIDYDLMLLSPQIEQRELITSVSATEYAYSLDSDAVELFGDTLNITGNQQLVVQLRDAPVTDVDITISGGTLEGTPKISATCVIATVAGSGPVTVSITGKRYIKNTRRVTTSMDALPAGDVPQTAEIADNTLLCGNADQVAVHVLAYYNKRIKQTMQFWADPALQAGDCVSVETMFGLTKKGVVESQELQFVPALRARLTVVG